MPIYEFYCEACNTIFNFFSRRINTSKQPSCPKCDQQLKRQMSAFATIGKAKENEDGLPPDIDEAKMEKVLGELAHEAENLNEDDPQQMAKVMRKFSENSGLNLGGSMEEALARMEAGEDPEKIEEEMGDIFENEDPFSFEKKKGRKRPLVQQPIRDETLYDL